MPTAYKFPADRNEAAELADKLKLDMRKLVGKINDTHARTGRWPIDADYLELVARRDALDRHLSALAEHEAEAKRTRPRPKRPPATAGEPVRLPPRPRDLQAADRRLADAREQLEACDRAIRDFAQDISLDRNQPAAWRRSVQLNAEREKAVQAVGEAQSARQLARAPYQHSMRKALLGAATGRIADALALVDKLDALLMPLHVAAQNFDDLHDHRRFAPLLRATRDLRLRLESFE